MMHTINISKFKSAGQVVYSVFTDEQAADEFLCNEVSREEALRVATAAFNVEQPGFKSLWFIGLSGYDKKIFYKLKGDEKVFALGELVD